MPDGQRRIINPQSSVQGIFFVPQVCPLYFPPAPEKKVVETRRRSESNNFSNKKMMVLSRALSALYKFNEVNLFKKKSLNLTDECLTLKKKVSLILFYVSLIISYVCSMFSRNTLC